MRKTHHLLFAFALLLVAAAASADSRLDFTRRAIQALPVFHEDQDYVDKAEQLEAIAVVVAGVSKAPPAGIAPKAWAALLLTIAFHESTLSERVQRGDYKPHEGDAHLVKGVRIHRARGLWQTHKNQLNAEDWEIANGNLDVQARLADQGLRRGYWTCARSGEPFPSGAINGYAGKRCSAQWPGLDKRLATFNRLMAR